MIKDSFVFYRSFFEAIDNIKDNAVIYKAICEYALNKKELDLEGVNKAIFTLIKPQLTANNIKFKNGCKGAKYGSLGGRPKKTKTPKKPLNNPKITPNANVNVNVNEECIMSNVNVNANANANGKNEIVKENEISLIINNWQKAKLDDFKIKGSFKTALVISHRKRMENKSFNDVQKYLESLGIYLNEDYSCSVRDGDDTDFWDRINKKSEVTVDVGK